MEKQLKLSEHKPGKTVSLLHIMPSFLESYNSLSNLGFGGYSGPEGNREGVDGRPCYLSMPLPERWTYQPWGMWKWLPWTIHIYNGGDWSGNNTLDAKWSRSQPGKGLFLQSTLYLLYFVVFHLVCLISISLHFYLAYSEKKNVILQMEDSMVILVIS